MSPKGKPNWDSFTREVSAASDIEEAKRRHECNRRGWNEAAVRYTEKLDQTIAFIAEGGSSLHPIERRNLGNLRGWCETAIHLQCASGRDTLSLWNEGVKNVIGIDISDVHISNARQLSEATAIPAKWYRCDVFEIPDALSGSADLVYTGRGVLCWLHDLSAWSGVICRLLKGGGIFHILDDHPMSWLFDHDKETLIYTGSNYFSYAESNKGWTPTYIGSLDKPVEQEATKYERLWPMSTIVQSLIDAGLTIEYLGEHADEYWKAFPNLRPAERELIPMTFSLKARKGQY